MKVEKIERSRRIACAVPGKAGRTGATCGKRAAVLMEMLGGSMAMCQSHASMMVGEARLASLADERKPATKRRKGLPTAAEAGIAL